MNSAGFAAQNAKPAEAGNSQPSPQILWLQWVIEPDVAMACPWLSLPSMTVTVGARTIRE
jgi:hypothetical protein